MKFLYAKGDVFALARFWEEDIVVAVISKSDVEETIRLPLGAVGAGEPSGLTDLLGQKLYWEQRDKHSICFKPKPHGAYLMACKAQNG